MYQKEIKQGNENIIFHSIYFTEDSFSIPDLTKITNMTFPTVKRVVNEFLEKDIIVEWTLSTGGVGRRAIKYKYNPDFCYSIGVSINEEKIKFVLINTIGKIFQSKIIDTQNENFIDFLTKNLKDFIKEIDEKYLAKVIGVGISIPGIYNKEDHFLEFNNTDRYESTVITEIEQDINLPIWVENEANMSILAEAIINKYKDLEDFTVINISNKVTCSTFHKFGNKSEDYFFKASRVHHMIVDYENQKKVGDCISFKVLKNEILGAFPKLNSLEDFFSNKTYRESKKGKEILNKYLTYMGIILKNLLFTYNPKKLIICGDLSQFGSYLLDDVLNIVYEKNHIFYRGKETIIFSDFKGSSSIIGAALFPIVDNLM